MIPMGQIASAIKRNIATRFSGSGFCALGASGPFNFDKNNAFSIYTWARWTQATTGHMAARVGNAASNTGWSLLAQATHLRFAHKSTATDRLIMETTSAFNDGKWHSIVSTYDGSASPTGVHIVVDNVDQSLTTVENTLTGSTKGTFNLEFGRDVNQSAFQFTGDCGSFAVYTGVLPATGINALYNGRKPADPRVGAFNSALGYWRMGDTDVFPTIKDRVGTTNGTLTNLTASAFKVYTPPYR